MTSEPMPKRGGKFEVEEMDHESLIYRRPSKTAIYLNDTATVIWKLCDGTRTMQQIGDLLAESYPDNAAEIRADVKATIDELVRSGVLRLADAQPDAVAQKVEFTTVDEVE